MNNLKRCRFVSILKKVVNKLQKIRVQFAFISCDSKNADRVQLPPFYKSKTIEEKSSGFLEITPVYGNKSAIVTIISDDGVYDSCVILNDLAKKYSIPMTIAGTVVNIEPYRRQWYSILKENYLELVNHSYNHHRMDEKSKVASSNFRLCHELVNSGKYFKKYFGIPSMSFVCPENQMCEKGYRILYKNGVLAVRRGTRGLNSLTPKEGTNPGEWHNLMCYGIMDPKSDNPEEERRHWVEQAIRENKWLIEMWHQVSENGNASYQCIKKHDAETHLEYLKYANEKNQIWIAQYSDVIKYLFEKQHASVASTQNGNTLEIKCDLDTDTLPSDYFNHPLTVKVNIEIDVSCEEKLKSRTDYLYENGKHYILVNIMPNTSKVIEI